MSLTLDTPYVTLEILENGILVATYKKRMLVTLDIAKEIVADRLEFTGRVPRPVLIINLGVLQIEKAARKYLSSGDGVAGISASAIIVDNLATFYIMSFILLVEKPPMPTAKFTRRNQAMDWLQTFL